MKRRCCFGILPAICLLVVFFSSDGRAGVLGQFTLSAVEEYNDNIFFSDKKEHDFITVVTPTFSLLYTSPEAKEPTFTASFSPTGELYLRHSEATNFGRNLSSKAGYTYHYSPRLDFQFSHNLRRSGRGRSGAVGDQGLLALTPPTVPTPPGEAQPPGVTQQLGDLISRGETLRNQLSAQGEFLYRPDVTFTGGYSFGLTNFLDENGSETSHSASFRGIYRWRFQQLEQDHNLHAGYRASLINSRNGARNIIHNADIGDDYFSDIKIGLDPTWTLSASGGIALNTGGRGPRVANNLQFTLKKVWEGASFNVDLRKGLTESFGVGGLSETTTLSSAFNINLTQYLTGTASVTYSIFDTDTTDFNVFQGRVGVQYQLLTWLSSSLAYLHRMRTSESGGTSAVLGAGRKINSNSVFVLFTAYFDVWPNTGLGKIPTRSRTFSSIGP